MTVALFVVPPPTGTYVTLTQHDAFSPTRLPVQLSDAIQNADEPVTVIANFPDFVELELPSLNSLVTRKPASTAPKS